MITLYSGHGSSQYDVGESALNDQDWQKIRNLAIGLLNRQSKLEASNILSSRGFKLHHGSNGFCDEFHVLYRKVPLDEYVTFGVEAEENERRQAYSQVAEVITELGFFIRFIGVEIDHNSSPQAVITPHPKITSSTVQHALGDAEQLVAQNRPVSAVDRAHTSLHGYLKEVCFDSNLAVQGQDPSLTELMKVLIKQHPRFNNLGTQADQIEKILKAMSVTCDALNPIRNHGSLAHANETLLDPAEAMLAINASRTLLHYVDQKLK